MAAEDDLTMLSKAWAATCAVAGREPAWLTFGLLQDAYSGADRHYHNVKHVAECLREMEGVRGACADPAAVEAALLFHDYVYDATRHDNEEHSADEAVLALTALRWAEERVQTVRQLILATKHSAAPATADAAIVVDIDLSILGKPQEVFDEYERAIRLEYGHVPEPAFRTGRAAVLRGFLSRPRIYASDYFARRYEMSARENLGRSLGALVGGI